MSSPLVTLLKSIVPATVHPHARTYVRRLVIWAKLMRQARGVTARDGLSLWFSFLASPFTAANGLDEWRDPLLLHEVTVDVRGIGRFSLRAHTDDLWHITPFRELAVLDCLKSRLRPGDCFVDAGANIGVYTILGAKLVGASGVVIAIEMMEANASSLRRHVHMNGTECVRVVEGALSTRAGEVIIASVPGGSYGQASIVNSDPGARFEVLTTTLDDVLGDNISVRLLKIDVEGAELEVLKGGLLALATALCLGPFLLLIALVIRLDSPGPALFWQRRVGFRGREINICKFRTMRWDEGGEGDERSKAITQPGDNRVTRFGKLLRRMRLDELPQLLNILRAEMSWIGPRPEVVALARWYEEEIPFYRYRHIVRPGISGWAQVSQGHVAEVDAVRAKLHYDFFYIRNFSPWLDLVILSRTVATIVSGFGAR